MPCAISLLLTSYCLLLLPCFDLFEVFSLVLLGWLHERNEDVVAHSVHECAGKCWGKKEWAEQIDYTVWQWNLSSYSVLMTELRRGISVVSGREPLQIFWWLESNKIDAFKYYQ